MYKLEGCFVWRSWKVPEKRELILRVQEKLVPDSHLPRMGRLSPSLRFPVAEEWCLEQLPVLQETYQWMGKSEKHFRPE